MKDTTNNPNTFQYKRQRKSKGSKPQKQIIFSYLKENTVTASMVCAETGIPQKSFCRRKRELEKAGLLWEVVKERCAITGCKAWFLTTDPDKVPNSNQLKMF